MLSMHSLGTCTLLSLVLATLDLPIMISWEHLMQLMV